VTKERILAAVGIKLNKPEEEAEEPAKQECGAH